MSHRAALDLPLAQSLHPILDEGMRADGIAEWLLELDSLKYTSDYLSYELCLEKDLVFSNREEAPPMFSKFNFDFENFVGGRSYCSCCRQSRSHTNGHKY